MKSIITFIILCVSLISFGQKAPLDISVTDFQQKPLQGEQVLFVHQTSKQTYKGVSDANGNISMELPAGKYDIQLKSVGDAQDYSTFEIPTLGPNESYLPASMQIQIQEAKSFTLDNLHFDTGKWTIKSSSFAELNELVEFMKNKKDVKIEIGGHTDSDGDETSNLTLSQKRAEAVKKYLISKGISADRIVAKGYGETRPVADNGTAQGKAMNRRTEIQIL